MVVVVAAIVVVGAVVVTLVSRCEATTTISRSAPVRSRRSSCRRLRSASPLRVGDTGHARPLRRRATPRRVDDRATGRTRRSSSTPHAPDRAAPTVQYAADGLPVAYNAGEKTLTVLEASPRSVSLDFPESQGRLITFGPDNVAYLLVESPGERTRDGSSPCRPVERGRHGARGRRVD